VKHICADIDIKEYSQSAENLIDLIHPSPALSGVPVQASITQISKIENHSRSYYCGYLGPINKSKLELFANIRCMEIFSDGYVIYVGGGIVAESELMSEWNETEMKAQTLLEPLTAILKSQELR